MINWYIFYAYIFYLINRQHVYSWSLTIFNSKGTKTLSSDSGIVKSDKLYRLKTIITDDKLIEHEITENVVIYQQNISSNVLNVGRLISFFILGISNIKVV